ncbi:MAG: glutamine amidotransferase [Propionibacteriaceae bacterium]|jgi:GMP synthase (glutamine-hydrolysing)|nr:glutamine amidotransferase [Propionibacteriaceae bacterium]
MKPFLLLTTREHDEAAAAEYASTMRFAGLDERSLRQFRLELEPLPKLDLSQWSGIILGGSGFCASEPEKSPVQQRVEADLFGLLDEVFERDFPFLGLCYGVGLLTMYLGGTVSHRFNEDVGAIPIALTAEGKVDPLLAGVPDVFHAFVGHKEGADALPPGATLLGSGELAPVQLFRAQRHIYACQFHPELDAADLVARMRIYKDAGYFDPDELEPLAQAAFASPVDGSQHKLLTNFARIGAAAV